MSVKNITDATNAAPIVITTSTSHGYSTNDIVSITLVGGNTNANGTWCIKVLDSTTFELLSSYGNADYTTGGRASKAGSITSLPTTAATAKETTTTTGTGDITLDGAVSGYATIAMLFADGALAEYRIDTVDGDGNPTGTYEVGTGTFNASPNTYSRTFVAFNNSNTNDPVDFSSGSKVITVQAPINSGTPAQVPETPSLTGQSVGGDYGSQGRLRCIKTVESTGHVTANGQSNVAYLCPITDTLNNSSFNTITMRILRQKAWWQMIGFNINPFDTFLQKVNIEDWKGVLRTPGFVDYPSVDVSQASPIPFKYDPATLPDQSKMSAFLPADFFIYMPIYSTKSGINPNGSQPRPKVFYLNWATQTSRYNDTVGHDLVYTNGVKFGVSSVSSVPGFWCLDTTGPSLTGKMSITDTLASVYANYPSYFRYIGTGLGFYDGTLINLPRMRCVQSADNKLAYIDTSNDTAQFWDVPIGNGSLMNYASIINHLTQWRHFWVEGIGGSGTSNLYYAKCVGYGKLQIAIALNSLTDFLRTGEDSQYAASPARTPSLGDSAVTGNPDDPAAANVYEIRAARLTANQESTKGFNVVNVLQFANSTLGVGTYRFFGHNQPINLSSGGVVFAGGTNPPGGPAEFRVIGIC